ncbi:MAG: SRPBCC domain-containing protein [Thermoplasmata archaeon]
MPTEFNPEPGTIRWRLHLRSPPEKVYDVVASDEGRSRFWVQRTQEKGDSILWTFGPGFEASMKVYERSRPRRFAFEFLDDSKVVFDIEPDGKGGTALTMTNSGLPMKDILDMTPGWVGILMNLKSVTDHSLDLRHRDPYRNWERGYVEP